MEELFNRPILDQLYDSISDDFETMLLKKKNSDGKFTESLKVEEELIYLIKKNIWLENFRNIHWGYLINMIIWFLLTSLFVQIRIMCLQH